MKTRKLFNEILSITSPLNKNMTSFFSTQLEFKTILVLGLKINVICTCLINFHTNARTSQDIFLFIVGAAALMFSEALLVSLF